MQAYYELEADIPADHQLNIHLPDNIPIGKAKVAIIYEVGDLLTTAINNKQQNDNTKPKSLTDFLGTGKPYSRFTSVKEIDAFVTENREIWES
jgi:hypothetical protein